MIWKDVEGFEHECRCEIPAGYTKQSVCPWTALHRSEQDKLTGGWSLGYYIAMAVVVAALVAIVYWLGMGRVW